MEYNDDSHYLCALQGGDTEDHQIFRRNHWMIDSGATNHLTPFKEDFIHFLTRQQLPLWQMVIKSKCMVREK